MRPHFVTGLSGRDSAPESRRKKKEENSTPRGTLTLWIVKGLVRGASYATCARTSFGLGRYLYANLSGVSLPPPQPRRFKSRQTFWRFCKDSSHESSLSYRYCRPFQSGSYILVYL